jgi:hypothetical protein
LGDFVVLDWLRELLPLLNIFFLFLAGLFIRRQRVGLNASIANLKTSIEEQRSKLEETVTGLRDQVQGLNQQVIAVRETVELAPVSSNGALNDGQSPVLPWEQFRSDWSDIRSRLEIVVNSLNGNVRRKYGRLKRYNYENLISVLRQDDRRITAPVAIKLQTMNNAFLQYRVAPRRLDTQTAQQLRQTYVELDQILPKIDD